MNPARLPQHAAELAQAHLVEGVRPLLNLRDLGGYPANKGLHVKRGLLYRSGQLSDATDDELEVLAGLGLASIVDLRSSAEATAEPDPELEGVAYTRVSGAMDINGHEINLSPRALYRLVMKPRRKDPDPERSLLSAISELYASLAFNNIAYRELFRQLLIGQVPVLWHCSAGKDRTGVAAFLVLVALGVAPEVAVQDYLLTNFCRAPYLDAAFEKHRLLGRTKLGAAALVARDGVLESCGRRVGQEILQQYESYDEFFLQEYNLAPAQIAQLRTTYLE